jgi:hypothetical protein
MMQLWSLNCSSYKESEMRIGVDWTKFPKRVLVIAALAIAQLTISSCHSDSSRMKAQEEQTATTAEPHNPAPLLNLNCVFDWIGNPTEAFHYSYSQHNESHSSMTDADVTPQSLDGTISNTMGGQAVPPVKVHAVRSDADGWRQGVSQLQMGFGVPSSLMMANKMSSELVRESAEGINGYDAVRYSVDTARLGATDRSMLGTSSEKGTVWVTGPGCPVKIVMDTETQENTAPSKTHYELAIVKK